MIRPRIKLRIAEYEEKMGRSVKDIEIARMLGVSQQRFSGWVNGRSFPNVQKLFELAHVLQCKVDDLYAWEGKKDD